MHSDRRQMLRGILPLTIVVVVEIAAICTGLLAASKAAAGGVTVSILTALFGRTLTLRAMGPFLS